MALIILWTNYLDQRTRKRRNHAKVMKRHGNLEISMTLLFLTDRTPLLSHMMLLLHLLLALHLFNDPIQAHKFTHIPNFTSPLSTLRREITIGSTVPQHGSSNVVVTLRVNCSA